MAGYREQHISPHVACKDWGQAAGLDRRTTERVGYLVSQRLSKREEEIFGWMKTVGELRRTCYRGVERTQPWAYFVARAYNLLRTANLGLSQQAAQTGLNFWQQQPSHKWDGTKTCPQQRCKMNSTLRKNPSRKNHLALQQPASDTILRLQILLFDASARDADIRRSHTTKKQQYKLLLRPI